MKEANVTRSLHHGIVEPRPDVLEYRWGPVTGRVNVEHRDRVLSAWWTTQDVKAAKAEVSLRRMEQKPVRLLRGKTG